MFPPQKSSESATGVWSASEHERFLEAMALYPSGPWRLITEHVGTRSIKQVQTHGQKYQQKLLRHQRGLRKTKMRASRAEHRVDESTVSQFTKGCIVRPTYRPSFEAFCTAASASKPSWSRSPCSVATVAEMSLAYPPRAIGFYPVQAHKAVYASTGPPMASGDYAVAQPSTQYLEPMPFNATGYPYPYGVALSGFDVHELRETLEVLLS